MLPNDADPAAASLHGPQLDRIAEHLETRYLHPGKIPGCLVAVMRDDKLGYLYTGGFRDLERQEPVTTDTVFRIYSMTKPITSIALMTLWEQGLFSLNDPVARFIPEFEGLRVRTGGSWPLFETRPAETTMTVRDLLCHTSGLTYDFLRATNIDYAYRKLQVGRPQPGYTLDTMAQQLSGLPLEFSPGTRWGYSVATDVLGLLIERLSGKPFATYLEDTIFRPLGMTETNFAPREDQIPRFASCYMRDMDKKLVLQDDGQDSQYVGRTFHSGGGGLVSTAGDYLSFCRMLANGGTLNGHRIIGSRTLELMTANHLPGGGDLASLSVAGFSETDHEGVGFGLGFASKLDPVKNGYPATMGSFYWGGLASTLFWVDPEEDLVVLFLTQLIPSSTFNFRGQLEALVYAALD